MPALVKAIKEKRFQQAKLLVASGYDINDKDKESGHNALIVSCLLDDEHKACCIIKWLLRHEACLLTSDNEGLTPLMHACKNRKYRLVELILKENDLDLKAQDNEGNSALLYAIKFGDLKITKMILREFVRRRVQGQDQANNAGETPLISAAKLGLWECCDVLLKGGKASPYARDFEMKMTAEEWKMSTLIMNSNSLPPRKNSLEGLKIFTGQVKSAKWCLVESSGGQNVIAVGSDQKSTRKQSSQPLVHTKSNHFHLSRFKCDERSGKLLDQRNSHRKRNSIMHHQDGDQDATDFQARNTVASTLAEVKDFHTRSRGHTSQGLKSKAVVNEPDRQRFRLKSRKDKRSVSAPQRAYASHVSRLRKTYDGQTVENIMDTRNDVPDWTQPKRQKSFTNDQLPSLLRVLGDQQSSSYRVKATPPTPEPELSKETDPRSKDILKRFAKAGFASVVMSKLTGVRRKSGATERAEKMFPPCGSTKSRTRSYSCRSDGSSHSAKSWWI